MANIALCQYMRVFDSSNTYYRWQNFYIGQAIEGYEHRPFIAGMIDVTSTGDQNSMQVTMAPSAEALSLVETALTNAHLVEIKIYKVPHANLSSPAGKVLIAQFIGEVVSGSVNDGQLIMELGSSLDPIGAQVPPRKFTTTLIGEPPRL
jgi:hypothetical protein